MFYFLKYRKSPLVNWCWIGFSDPRFDNVGQQKMTIIDIFNTYEVDKVSPEITIRDYKDFVQSYPMNNNSKNTQALSNSLLLLNAHSINRLPTNISYTGLKVND